MSLFPSTEKKPFCRTYAKEKRCNLKKDYNASENPYSILPDVSICPLFRLLKFPLRLLLQSVCRYRSYHQAERRAAAALYLFRRAYLKETGLRIYIVTEHKLKKDLQTGVLSFILNIRKVARGNIHFITYLFAAFLASCPRSFYRFSKGFEVIFFYWSFCHIYSPSYILLFPFLLGYVYTVPLISHNNSYLYTCYYSYVRL